jgi:hypothetical protein
MRIATARRSATTPAIDGDLRQDHQVDSSVLPERPEHQDHIFLLDQPL